MLQNTFSGVDWIRLKDAFWRNKRPAYVLGIWVSAQFRYLKLLNNGDCDLHGTTYEAVQGSGEWSTWLGITQFQLLWQPQRSQLLSIFFLGTPPQSCRYPISQSRGNTEEDDLLCHIYVTAQRHSNTFFLCILPVSSEHRRERTPGAVQHLREQFGLELWMHREEN